MTQLLNEVRNTLLRVQIILVGLLTLPFTGRFQELSRTQEAAYFVSLASAALASSSFGGEQWPPGSNGRLLGDGWLWLPPNGSGWPETRRRSHPLGVADRLDRL